MDLANRADGHSGLENTEVNRGGSGRFSLVLSALKTVSGHHELIIHATSATSYSHGLQPLPFLESLGFKHFKGDCGFHQDRCFYKLLTTIAPSVPASRDIWAVQQFHAAFAALANRIGELFDILQKAHEIAGGIVMIVPPSLFAEPGQIVPATAGVPGWIDQIKTDELKNLELERERVDSQIRELSMLLPLAYAEGTELESAVLAAFQQLGLRAVLAPPGFTIDILASLPDGSHSYGIEVTGLGGPIAKASKKLIQLAEFEAVKEHNEKTILVANTYRDKPPPDRDQLQNFTAEALTFLGRFPVLLMTGLDLYRIVRDMRSGLKTRDEILALLDSYNGLLSYR